MQPGNVMYANRKRNTHPPRVGVNATELVADGFCVNCMRKAGYSAYEVLEVLLLEGEVDASALRCAGYSLCELCRARERLPALVYHPPPSKRTMFDSQLKLAGYSAKEFREAGFTADQLSSNEFWKYEYNMTNGEREWADTCAFFDARELREANYSAHELLRAGFRDEELCEAGFAEVVYTGAQPKAAKGYAISDFDGSVYGGD